MYASYLSVSVVAFERTVQRRDEQQRPPVVMSIGEEKGGGTRGRQRSDRRSYGTLRGDDSKASAKVNCVVVACVCVYVYVWMM